MGCEKPKDRVSDSSHQPQVKGHVYLPPKNRFSPGAPRRKLGYITLQDRRDFKDVVTITMNLKVNPELCGLTLFTAPKSRVFLTDVTYVMTQKGQRKHCGWFSRWKWEGE